MGKLTVKERCIVMMFLIACGFMVIAAAEWMRGGSQTLEYIELSIMSLVLSRVM